MVTYEKLSRRPKSAPSLIGMSLSSFDELYTEFEKVHSERITELKVTRREGKLRKRAVGGGNKHRYSLRDRLLLTLFWLRVYTTYEVMGFFYELDKTNIEDNLKDILASLAQMTSFSYEHPKDKQQKKLRSVEGVMDAFPDVRLVIDAKEQRVQRPKNKKGGDGNPADRQRPYYSGKKKTHTIKNQIAVRPDGLIEVVSGSVPGGANHDITVLRQTNLLDELDEDEAAMMDKGYDGIKNDYPDTRIYQPYKARRNHPLTDEQKVYNRFLSSYRVVVEHTLAQMNKYQVLAQIYRHQKDEHTQIVRVVAGLVNRKIQATPLKTYAVA
ncbi:MAG: transposase family protein [Anaerolineales bacterium]